MPTPVDVARQCLAEAAAAVLDDAVAVAKRRSHAQTTSLHIVSALLSLPSSTLRDACARARSSAYSPRLQFRALDLCVGVALDRVSVSKSASDEPPVSNSLMAAIKRSQANQRRHPETFHLYQQQLNSDSQNCTSIYAVKVEMKHFVMSILDDPIVSRVLSDAGFRTHELKMAIVNPLTITRFPSTSSRPPPLFPCSLGDFELGNSRVDDNSKRIGETLIKDSRRNPLLIGAYASDAHRVFIDCLKRGGNGVLPKEIDGLSLVSIEREISEFFAGSTEAMMGLKFKQLDEMVQDCRGPGIIVNCGDLKVFVDAESVNVVADMVSGMKRLLLNHGRKLSLVCFLGDDGDYKKLVERIQTIEMDWDLHLLPITTATTGEKCFKSSLLRSFVPLGGFFSMPSDNENISATTAKPSTLCNACNQKYEQEVSAVLKGGVTTNAVADKASGILSSWMQIAGKRSVTAEVKEDKTVLDARVGILKRKWSEICRRLHSSSTSQEDVTLLPKSHTAALPSLKDTAGVGSSLNGSRMTNLSACMPSNLQKNSLPLQETPTPIFSSGHVETRANIAGHGQELNNLHYSSASSQQKMNLTPIACTSSVTTNLRLGTLYGSDEECKRKLDIREYYNVTQSSESSRGYEISSSQAPRSSSWSHHRGQTMYVKDLVKDLENPWAALAEKVYWQMEAIQTISQTISRCKNGNKGSVWLSFVGPDKVGKRKIASGVAEIVFGRKENLLSLDLNPEYLNYSNSIVDCYDSNHHKLNLGRKMIVDYLGQELRKHPHSVVLLENVDKADFLVRDSLCRAVKTGRFPDSHGRDTVINNNVFVLASTTLKVTEDYYLSKVSSEFPEDKILEAKNSQMQIILGSSGGNYTRNNATTNVSVTPSRIISKRKSSNDDLTEGEMPKRACRSSRSIIDLNLPVEEMETEEGSDDGNDNSDKPEAWLEELCCLVDEKVVLKSYDFDSLCQKILKDIDARLKKVGGPTIWLEIDRQVMFQILAAAWGTENGKNALEDWIERVLCSSVEEAVARQRHGVDVLVKLVQCDGVGVEAKADGICLPGRINIT